MPGFVTALKSYGQHFLTDKSVLERIVALIKQYRTTEKIVEIGPGTGALTTYLLKEWDTLTCIEVDHRCVEHLTHQLKPQYPGLEIREADFLRLDMNSLLTAPTAIVGNFPYNISSQIIFRILEHREHIPFMVGMFQKEMAERIASPHGSKVYGVISVLTQLFYDVKLEFDIAPQSFAPPPKVMSSVISLHRKQEVQEGVDLALLTRIVKAGFNQRRKMLRNGLSGLVPKDILQQELFQQRAEQLSVADFIALTRLIQDSHAR